LLLEFLESSAQHANAFAEQSAISFELGFTRSAKTDTTFLTLKVSPTANEPAREMSQLRKLNFELAFVATRSLSKDIEDERIPIEHSKASQFFEVTFLTRRECVIDQDHLGTTVDRRLTNLFGLAAAHEVPRIRSLAATGDGDGRAHSRRLRKLRELLEIFAFYRPVKTNANEDGAFAAAGTLKHE